MEQKFREFTKSDVSLAVKDHYRKMRQNQTFDYVKRMHNKYLNFNNPMELWEAMYSLDNLIDVSDPDLDLPNVQHLIQSAEAIRNDNRPDWMQLTGLIHDLGKTMYLWGCDKDGTSQKEQWGLVGDVFVVGCSLPKSCVFPEFNKLNPDSFSSLALDFSDGPSKSSGGDLGFFQEGMMVKPFNDYVFKNNIGRIGVVETEFGFHVIKVVAKEDLAKVATIALKNVPSNFTSDSWKFSLNVFYYFIGNRRKPPGQIFVRV